MVAPCQSFSSNVWAGGKFWKCWGWVRRRPPSPSHAFAQDPTFPKGAVIRTLLKDYAPEDLAGGATLFHEHMQLGPDFNAKFSAASAAVRAANGLPPAPARGGGGGGNRGGGTAPRLPTSCVTSI